MDKLIGNTIFVDSNGLQDKENSHKSRVEKKIKEENAKRVKRVEKVKGKVEEVKKESKKRGWGMNALKEIRSFQSLTQTSYSKIAIPKAGEGVDPGKMGGSEDSGPGSKGLTRNRRSIPGGVA